MGRVTADEGRVGGGCVALDDVLSLAAVVAHQQVFIVALVGIVAVLDPLLLHEFELAGEAGVERHEDDAALVLEFGWVGWWRLQGSVGP